jgi:ribosomal protein S27AE
MPRGKINLQKALASLNSPCPRCGHQITPAEIKRVTWDKIECPACGEQFDPAVSRQARKAQES